MTSRFASKLETGVGKSVLPLLAVPSVWCGAAAPGWLPAHSWSLVYRLGY